MLCKFFLQLSYLNLDRSDLTNGHGCIDQSRTICWMIIWTVNIDPMRERERKRKYTDKTLVSYFNDEDNSNILSPIQFASGEVCE